MSRYDFHKGFDSRWYVTFKGFALDAYPSKAQAMCKWVLYRRYELQFPRDYMASL